MKTIKEAIEASGELETGDLDVLIQALEEKGYPASSKAGPGFLQVNHTTLGTAGEVTERQMKLLAAVQTSLRPSTVSTGIMQNMRVKRLRLFVDAIQDPQVAASIRRMEVGSVFHLGQGAQWFGLKNVATADLYVRACYPELLEAGEQYRRTKGRLSDPFLLTYTGTPGVGKTHLEALVAAKAILDGRRVVLEQHNSKEARSKTRWFLMDTSGADEVDVHTALSNIAHMCNPSAKPPLYIIDGGASSFDQADYDGVAYVFASPSSDLTHAERKGDRGVILHMPLADFAELKEMKSLLPAFEDMPNELLQRWFDSAGGVPRTCLLKAWSNKSSLEGFCCETASVL